MTDAERRKGLLDKATGRKPAAAPSAKPAGSGFAAEQETTQDILLRKIACDIPREELPRSFSTIVGSRVGSLDPEAVAAMDSLPPDEAEILKRQLRKAREEERVADARKLEMEQMRLAAMADGGTGEGSLDTLLGEDATLESTSKPPEPATGGADTGAKIRFCPRCDWRLDIPVEGGEIAWGDKVGFLQTLIGQIPFRKTYPLYGGQVRVSFRTLSRKEIVAIDNACQEMVREGLLDLTQAGFQFQVLRMALQLVELSMAGEAWRAEDGLSSTTAPRKAKTYWSHKFSGLEGRALLRALLDHIETEVVTTESLTRIILHTNFEFNRLTDRLERMDHQDFTERTAPQS